MIHAGVNMRLQTPGKTARFYGNFGGGYVWESLEFNYGDAAGLVTCLTPLKAPGIAPSCENIDGSDGYFLIEGSSGVLSSLSFFESSEQADKATMLVSEWITDEHFDSAIPNPPKITSGKVVAHSDRVLAVA